MVGCGPMPVLLARRDVDDVAGADLDDVAATRLRQPPTSPTLWIAQSTFSCCGVTLEGAGCGRVADR